MSASPVILITGASSGIGAATARLFGIEKGYRVVLAARRVERLQALADEIQAAGGEALAVETDLTEYEQITHLVASTLEQYGQIDVLFNNAGFGRLKWLEQLDPQRDIAAQLQLNLTALIQIAQLVLPHMIARRSGHIINMASVSGWIATPTYSVYAASKFGVRGFTEALRREANIRGIQVSGIYPGPVETEFSHHTEVKEKISVPKLPFLRLTAPQVAAVVWRLTQRPRSGVIIPWPMGIFSWLNLLLPGIVDRILQKSYSR